jgi:23S rRNA (uridine2552-2'-O)-methyltransferase
MRPPARPKGAARSHPAGGSRSGARKHRFGKEWMREHLADHWVHEAKRLGYRSRAAFKLMELLERDRLLRPGMRVADLGAAPGSWSQLLAARLGAGATIHAVDVLPMEPIPGVDILQGDFTDADVTARFEQRLGGERLDLVVSDLAPNLSGVATVDQARSMRLVEGAVEFACKWLKPGGNLVIKVFQGPELQAMQRQLATRFGKVAVRKPKASRDRSAELYLVAIGFIPATS